MENYQEEVKRAFGRTFNLDPDFPDNSHELVQFYHDYTLAKSLQTTEPKPVIYRRQDVPKSMMGSDDELAELGTSKEGLFHGVVDGIARIGEDNEEIPYSYGLIEDNETGNFYTVDLQLIAIKK